MWDLIAIWFAEGVFAGISSSALAMERASFSTVSTWEALNSCPAELVNVLWIMLNVNTL